MAAGLQYFFTTVVNGTDIAGSKTELKTVKWGADVCADLLLDLASTAPTSRDDE